MSKTDEEERFMSKVPNANSVGCLMYVMIDIILDLAHIISVISRFISNLGKEH